MKKLAASIAFLAIVHGAAAWGAFAHGMPLLGTCFAIIGAVYIAVIFAATYTPRRPL